MRSVKWAIILGLVVWAIPFVLAILIFPLREADRPFFESIMPVAVATVTVLAGAFYFNKVEAKFLREGVWLGIIFLVISLAIDLLMFSRGPMAMSLTDYIKDIGFTYLLIPVITIGMGYILNKKLR